MKIYFKNTFIHLLDSQIGLEHYQFMSLYLGYSALERALNLLYSQISEILFK